MLDVHCVKQGTPSIHPISGDELRALLRLQREQERKSPFVFASEHHSLRQVLHGRSSARASKRSLASRVIRTCCVMPADTRSPTRDTKRAPCKFTWDTATFNTPCVTPNYHRRALRTSGANSLATATWCRIEAP